jgi:hypothetical protein
MNAKFSILLVISMIYICSYGQEELEEFKLRKSQFKISNSKYNSICFVDSRINTCSMGIVQVGLGNNRAKVITKIPLSLQLTNFLNSVIDSTSQNDTLLFQLRNILFAETTTMTSEKGYFYFQANLFTKKQNKYKKIGYLDTMITVKALDVTNRLFKEASDIITNYILSNLNLAPTSTEQYSYNDILKVDSIEKRSIKVYNISEYKDGIYYLYNSFKNQIPDNEIIVKRRRDQSIDKVLTKDSDNNIIKLRSDKFYAFVFEGKPYISTGYGYYPLIFNNDSFYFIGKIKPITPNYGHILAAEVMFGIIGGIIASNSKGAGENYYTIIDHNNGGFIPLRKIPIISY